MRDAKPEKRHQAAGHLKADEARDNMNANGLELKARNLFVEFLVPEKTPL